MPTSASSSSAQAPVVPPFKLMEQITAYRTSQCIRVLVELGIPALLEHEALSLSELSGKTGTRPELLERILDHLVNEDVIGKDCQGRFIASPVTCFLAPDHHQSLHNWVTCELDPLLWRSWEKLVEQLRSGTTAFDLTHGAAFFEWHARDSAAQKRFDDQMSNASRGIGSMVVKEMKFPEGARVMDIGGGNGAFLAQLLETNPGVEGILFELPRTDKALDPAFEKMQRAGRARVEHGSFFDCVPTGADAFLFSRVFHDFNDEAAAAILANTKRVLTGSEQLFLIDIMADEKNGGARTSSQDVFMLTQLGGRERSSSEYMTLLSQNGFETVNVTPTASPVSILEFRVSD